MVGIEGRKSGSMVLVNCQSIIAIGAVRVAQGPEANLGVCGIVLVEKSLIGTADFAATVEAYIAVSVASIITAFVSLEREKKTLTRA